MGECPYAFLHLRAYGSRSCTNINNAIITGG